MKKYLFLTLFVCGISVFYFNFFKKPKFHVGDCIYVNLSNMGVEEPLFILRIEEIKKNGYRTSLFWPNFWMKSSHDLEFAQEDIYNKTECPLE